AEVPVPGLGVARVPDLDQVAVALVRPAGVRDGAGARRDDRGAPRRGHVDAAVEARGAHAEVARPEVRRQAAVDGPDVAVLLLAHLLQPGPRLRGAHA